MYCHFVKHILDLIIALILLPLYIIIYMTVAVAIKFDDGGPIIYKGKRLGKNGKIFNMYKFRTMAVNSLDIRNSDGTTYNSKYDPRVTKIGHILREISLDELPQILNIIRGQMSFIGPRPDTIDSLKRYTYENLKKLKVKPGITGYNQAYYRNSSSLEQRFTNDIYYAENISFILDLKILVHTFIIIAKREHIYNSGVSK